MEIIIISIIININHIYHDHSEIIYVDNTINKQTGFSDKLEIINYENKIFLEYQG